MREFALPLMYGGSGDTVVALTDGFDLVVELAMFVPWRAGVEHHSTVGGKVLYIPGIVGAAWHGNAPITQVV